MEKIIEMRTNYKVLATHIPFTPNRADPIMIICENAETHERRKIDVYYQRSVEEYNAAALLIVGDTITVEDVTFDCGKKLLKKLIVHFKKEKA